MNIKNIWNHHPNIHVSFVKSLLHPNCLVFSNDSHYLRRVSYIPGGWPDFWTSNHMFHMSSLTIVKCLGCIAASAETAGWRRVQHFLSFPPFLETTHHAAAWLLPSFMNLILAGSRSSHTCCSSGSHVSKCSFLGGGLSWATGIGTAVSLTCCTMSRAWKAQSPAAIQVQSSEASQALATGPKLSK